MGIGTPNPNPNPNPHPNPHPNPTGSGLALMGIGTADGKNRAHDAAVAAVSSPLIDFPIAEAKGIVLTITGSSDMTLQVYPLWLC
jgi:hypothetical protein